MSGLSLVSVLCEEALFLNGIAVPQIWFQVLRNLIVLSLGNFNFFFFIFVRLIMLEVDSFQTQLFFQLKKIVYIFLPSFFFFFFFFFSNYFDSEFGPIQLFLSCGINVTIKSQMIGYGMGELPSPSLPSSLSFFVQSWENEEEELFNEAEVFFFFF